MADNVGIYNITAQMELTVTNNPDVSASISSQNLPETHQYNQDITVGDGRATFTASYGVTPTAFVGTLAKPLYTTYYNNDYPGNGINGARTGSRIFFQTINRVVNGPPDPLYPSSYHPIPGAVTAFWPQYIAATTGTGDTYLSGGHLLWMWSPTFTPQTTASLNNIFAEYAKWIGNPIRLSSGSQSEVVTVTDVALDQFTDIGNSSSYFIGRLSIDGIGPTNGLQYNWKIPYDSTGSIVSLYGAGLQVPIDVDNVVRGTPSWTQNDVGYNHAWVQQPFSSTFHEITQRNATLPAFDIVENILHVPTVYSQSGRETWTFGIQNGARLIKPSPGDFYPYTYVAPASSVILNTTSSADYPVGTHVRIIPDQPLFVVYGSYDCVVVSSSLIPGYGLEVHLSPGYVGGNGSPQNLNLLGGNSFRLMTGTQQQLQLAYPLTQVPSYYTKTENAPGISASQRFQQVTYTVKANDGLILQSLSGALPILKPVLFDPTLGAYANRTPYDPKHDDDSARAITFDVKEYGRIRDVKLWVEMLSDLRETGSYKWQDVGLQNVQLTLVSPNVKFRAAHPLWNSPAVQTFKTNFDPNLTGTNGWLSNSFYNYIPRTLQSSYLLWDGHRVNDALKYLTSSGDFYDGNSPNGSPWHEFDTDLDMRTIFWDASPVANPHATTPLFPFATEDSLGQVQPTQSLITGDHYYSPSYLLAKNFGPDYIQGLASKNDLSLTGARIPWFDDQNVNVLTASSMMTQHVLTQPPPGWLTGPQNGVFESWSGSNTTLDTFSTGTVKNRWGFAYEMPPGSTDLYLVGGNPDTETLNRIDLVKLAGGGDHGTVTSLGYIPSHQLRTHGLYSINSYGGTPGIGFQVLIGGGKTGSLFYYYDAGSTNTYTSRSIGSIRRTTYQPPYTYNYASVPYSCNCHVVRYVCSPAIWVPVQMADGTTKEARFLKPGDRVWTRPEHADDPKYGSYLVTSVVKEFEEHVREVYFTDGRMLAFSAAHKLLRSNDWIEVQDLQPGDVIQGSRPGTVKFVKEAAGQYVVRIGVSQAQTYETDGIVSHNLPCTNCQVNGGGGGVTYCYETVCSTCYTNYAASVRGYSMVWIGGRAGDPSPAPQAPFWRGYQWLTGDTINVGSTSGTAFTLQRAETFTFTDNQQPAPIGVGALSHPAYLFNTHATSGAPTVFGSVFDQDTLNTNNRTTRTVQYDIDWYQQSPNTSLTDWDIPHIALDVDLTSDVNYIRGKELYNNRLTDVFTVTIGGGTGWKPVVSGTGGSVGSWNLALGGAALNGNTIVEIPFCTYVPVRGFTGPRASAFISIGGSPTTSADGGSGLVKVAYYYANTPSDNNPQFNRDGWLTPVTGTSLGMFDVPVAGADYIPVGVVSSSVCVDYSLNRVYVAGGIGPNLPGAAATYGTTNIWVCDLEHDNSGNKTGMPATSWRPAGILPTGSYAAESFISNGFYYIMGGAKGSGIDKQTIPWAFRAYVGQSGSLGNWTQLTYPFPDTDFISGSYPVPRSGTGAGLLDGASFVYPDPAYTTGQTSYVYLIAGTKGWYDPTKGYWPSDYPGKAGSAGPSGSMFFPRNGSSQLYSAKIDLVQGGTSQLAGADEWQTAGGQIGPETIRPAYPMLDDVYSRFVTSSLQTSQFKLPVNKITGFRPGLKNTEVHGVWKLRIANSAGPFNASAPEFIGSGTAYNPDPSKGVWFRQARLEFLIDKGSSAQEMVYPYPSRRRMYNRTSQVSISDRKRMDVISGSAYWDTGVIYVYNAIEQEYGRTVGISQLTGTGQDAFAVFSRITGTLADNLSSSFGNSTPSWYLGNEFGTPYIPISSGTTGDSFDTSALNISASQFYLSQVTDQQPTVPYDNTLQAYLNRIKAIRTTDQIRSSTLDTLDNTGSYFGS